MSTFAPVDINTTVSNFFQNGTPITIETKDLLLRPIQESDLGFMQNLYTDPVTMKLFVDNEKRFENKGAEAWKKEQMKAANGRVNTLLNR